MCIIIYKNSGVDNPTNKVLATCLKSHKDGFGVMWRLPHNKVRIIKGLYDIDSIIKITGHIPKEAEAAFHFRQSTHGVISAGNCHPFPLSARNDALTSTSGIFDSGLVHNGIINDFGTRNSSNFSDTMNFIKYLERATGKIYRLDRIDRHIKGHYGKFVVFTPQWTYFWGQFFEEKKLKYSNTSYRDFDNVWGCNRKQEVDYGKWDPINKVMVYKNPPKTHLLPLVAAVDPADIKWQEGVEIAEYKGRKGNVVYFQGTTIFCEEGFEEVELELLMEDIRAAIIEGEFEGLY
jgi:hypothetical protein